MGIFASRGLREGSLAVENQNDYQQLELITCGKMLVIKSRFELGDHHREVPYRGRTQYNSRMVRSYAFIVRANRDISF